MVRATLTGNGTTIPELSDISSVLVRYAYDEAGNLLRVTMQDDSGVRQDVESSSWASNYDLNGNLTWKTNCTHPWMCT
ncbi:hypothetical protein JST97_35690 [bacterium]|nr:hypothetical protein [bacterium]